MSENRKMTARDTALEVLMQVERANAWSDGSLKRTIAKNGLEGREAALATRLAYGVIQNRTLLDYYISCYCVQKAHKLEPVIRNILRCAVYQIKYMDQVPDSAACNEAVNLAIRKGFKNLRGFVNGVLRNIARNIDKIAYPENAEEFLSVKYSMP